MNDKIKNELKMKIAISKIRNEEEKNMNKTGKFIFKNIGIAACTIMVLTGGVFATSKVIENIWKTPKKIENVTEQITEESKKENITEDQAKEIAIQKLEQIGFNTNIINTNHYKEIAQVIGEKLDRGSTAIYAKGMYTKEKRMMLWCVASRGEVAKIKQIAQEIDPRAFIVISSAREAWGKGFKR